MSAPNQGRQSPDPENQSGAQQQDVPAGGHADSAPSEAYAKDSSENAKQSDTLSSNPEHILDKTADAKISKEPRGEGV